MKLYHELGILLLFYLHKDKFLNFWEFCVFTVDLISFHHWVVLNHTHFCCVFVELLLNFLLFLNYYFLITDFWFNRKWVTYKALIARWLRRGVYITWKWSWWLAAATTAVDSNFLFSIVILDCRVGYLWHNGVENLRLVSLMKLSWDLGVMARNKLTWWVYWNRFFSTAYWLNHCIHQIQSFLKNSTSLVLTWWHIWRKLSRILRALIK